MQNFQQNKHNYVDLEIFSVTCSLYSVISGSIYLIIPMFLNFERVEKYSQKQHLYWMRKDAWSPEAQAIDLFH